MPDARRAGVLEPLRARVRRLLLVVGLGFLSLAVGGAISVPLQLRLAPLLQALGSDVASSAAAASLGWLWLWAVLPLLCYALARVIELRPWSTALGAALTGELFLLALLAISSGIEGFELPKLSSQAVCFAAGVILVRTAVARGRAAAARSQEAATRAAEARRREYAEFASQASAPSWPPGRDEGSGGG